MYNAIALRQYTKFVLLRVVGAFILMNREIESIGR